MNKLLKVELQGYLQDRVTSFRDLASKAGYIVVGENLLKLVEITSIINKSVKNITVSDISDSFLKLENIARDMGGWNVCTAKESEEEPAEPLEVSALPYIAIAREFIQDRGVYSIDDELYQLRRQLEESVFANLTADDLHVVRNRMNYELTEGADYLQFPEIEISDYFERFSTELHRAVEQAFPSSSWDTPSNITQHNRAWRRFWLNASVQNAGLEDNTISEVNMKTMGIRSPKFSKLLYQTFGEKSTVVKMFNDRPKKENLIKKTATILENGNKVIVSNLSQNVMKMTFGNCFNSCQDYGDESEHLLCLPASVRDATLSIAYLCDEEESPEYPQMLGRILLKTMEYNGKLFVVGFNGYGDYGTIISTLKTVYGSRFISEYDVYIDQPENMFVFTFEDNYSISVELEGYSRTVECWVCDGRRNVDAETSSGYQFHTECPLCEGEGELEDEGGNGYYCDANNAPYVNGWAVGYRPYKNESYVKVPRHVLEDSFKKELSKMEDTGMEGVA